MQVPQLIRPQVDPSNPALAELKDPQNLAAASGQEVGAAQREFGKGAATASDNANQIVEQNQERFNNMTAIAIYNKWSPQVDALANEVYSTSGMDAVTASKNYPAKIAALNASVMATAPNNAVRLMLSQTFDSKMTSTGVQVSRFGGEQFVEYENKNKEAVYENAVKGIGKDPSTFDANMALVKLIADKDGPDQSEATMSRVGAAAVAQGVSYYYNNNNSEEGLKFLDAHKDNVSQTDYDGLKGKLSGAINTDKAVAWGTSLNSDATKHVGGNLHEVLDMNVLNAEILKLSTVSSTVTTGTALPQYDAAKVTFNCDKSEFTGMTPTMQTDTLTFFQQIYAKFGQVPGFNSGKRSEALNNSLPGAAKDSFHLRGLAADLDLSKFTADQVQQIIQMAKDDKFGEVQYSNEGTGLHLHIANPQAGPGVATSTTTHIDQNLYAEYKKAADDAYRQSETNHLQFDVQQSGAAWAWAKANPNATTNDVQKMVDGLGLVGVENHSLYDSVCSSIGIKKSLDSATANDTYNKILAGIGSGAITKPEQIDYSGGGDLPPALKDSLKQQLSQATQLPPGITLASVTEEMKTWATATGLTNTDANYSATMNGIMSKVLEEAHRSMSDPNPAHRKTTFDLQQMIAEQYVNVSVREAIKQNGKLVMSPSNADLKAYQVPVGWTINGEGVLDPAGNEEIWDADSNSFILDNGLTTPVSGGGR